MSYPIIDRTNIEDTYKIFTDTIFEINNDVLEKIKSDEMMFSNLYTFINNNIGTFYYEPSDYFYKLSNFIFTLPWNYRGHYRYTPTNNGLLSKNSLNCKFTIAKLDNIQNGSTEELFIKVVNIESNQNDYIMIDVISAILFETIYNYK
jgi:hypothetical protein